MIETMSNIQPLTAFRDNPAELLDQLKATHRSITLTVDGKPAAILQEPAEYQRLLDMAAQFQEDDLRLSLLDVTEGRTRPAREVFAELREEYGIRG